uniref:SREBP regulating gene protein n=1 Tax=Lynceus sp. MCZ IZ 141354 TaxID=1930659 RepID=A0A9N6ZFN8_9CRUS|nr:EOG090X0AGU [Lynceus sp. MCZ IZ 141354]
MWISMIARCIRSKAFLTIFFLASLIYCLLNAYNVNLGGSQEDYDGPDFGAGRRPLSHFRWHSSSIDAPNNNDSQPTSCRNSVQGKVLMADDKGYVCNRHAVQPNGCCKIEAEGSKRYNCQTCQENGCCSIYEFCISCCLQPEKKEVLEDVLGKAAGSLNLLLQSVTDHFELCLTKCRTSSQSVQHENSYRNARAKYCYGGNPPPLETEGTIVEH